jgi:hypothetical protein
MPPPDDIKGDHLTDLEETKETDTTQPPGAKPLKEIGPESEVRGGPEAPLD